MNEWPEHIEYAIKKLGYEYPYDEKAVEDFVRHWGGLELEICRHVLKEGQGNEKLLALFAIGYQDTAEAQTLLLPFLVSENPLERWVSVLCLGEMKDERAFPILCKMLTEFLPPDEQITSEGYFEWRYDYWRPTVARLLGEWKRPSLAPILYAALKELWRQEQTASPQKLLTILVWHFCQDQLAYALGQLGCFKQERELEELDASEARVSLWMVCMALGHLEALTLYPGLFSEGLWNKPALRKQVAEVLGQQFGCSPKEQERHLHLYQQERLNRGGTEKIVVYNKDNE